MHKYGMKFHTIRYWQDAAKNLWMTHNIIRGVSTFSSDNLEIADSQDIGHHIIGIAYVMSADKLKQLLSE